MIVASRMAAMLVAATLSIPALAHAQTQDNGAHISGYATFGNIMFAAHDSFDAVLGTSSGPIFGGGLRIDLGIGGLFFDVGAWRFQKTGERVFVYQGQVIPLGLAVDVSAIPVEVTGGWRFHLRRWPKLSPYVAGGLTSMRYQEESDFSTGLENDDQTFNGAVASAGAEYKVMKWINVGGEAAWSSLPDAIGKGGVSKAYDENDLGGASFRFKIIVRR